jgi:glycosyl hydrolase family 42 (putative beta-galactosidase)
MHYAPSWLEKKHPDLYFKKADGSRGEGGFFYFCPDKEKFRNLLKPALEKFITAFKDHPQLLAYSPWNEPGLSPDVCFCKDTLEKYGKTPPEKITQGKEWLSWMQFRQESFLDFFKWINGVIKDIDPDHPITIKGVWCPMDSKIAWSHGTRYDYWESVSDIMGHDPYPHPYDYFINRWVADWLRSSGNGKPSILLEYNRAFGREHGLTTPEEMRSWTYQAIAHGINGFIYFFYPMNPFNPEHGDDHLAFSYNDTLEAVPALKEIYKIAKELKRVTPDLEGFTVPEPEIAILHSWPTYLQMAGEMFPTANETVPAKILYMLGHRVQFVTEKDIESEKLKGIKLLFVTGTVAISDKTLKAIKKYHKKGGQIVACARFAERDENFKPRQFSPPSYFGVEVLERFTEDREKIDLPDFINSVHYNNHSSKKDVIKKFRYGTAYPMSWESPLFRLFYDHHIKYLGKHFTGGEIIGFEDMTQSEEIIENLSIKKDADILASFGPMKPAIVSTPGTIYIGRDLSWSGETMQKLIEMAVKRAGIKRYTWATGKKDSPLPFIDIGDLENENGERIIIITCSGRLYEWDATPEKVKIHIRTQKPLTDLLTQKKIPTKIINGITIIEKVFNPGEVMIIGE